MRRSRCALALLLALAPAGCGSEVKEAQASGTTGGGGAPTTSSGTTTGTSSTTGSGGGGASCGGKVGAPCGPGMFCKFDASSACGNFDSPGTCQPEPQGCDADCPGVCGCDGKLYCNACSANAAGVDVSGETSCVSGDSYRAVGFFTNVSRYGILKASPARNLCFRLTAEASQSVGIGIFGDGFTVTIANVTHDVSDCSAPAGPFPAPAGATYPAASGSGALSLAMSSAGCVTGIHAQLAFSGEPPWAPPSEPLDADGLTLEGGCP